MSHVLLRCVMGDEPLQHIPLTSSAHPFAPALSRTASALGEHSHCTPAVMGVSDE